MVEKITGPDITFGGGGISQKRARGGPATPWHRDASHTPVKPLATTSVWIAVFYSLRTNGCLQFLPGSHAAKQAGNHIWQEGDDLIFGVTVDKSEVDESKAVDVELRAGEMVLFDIFTIHGARHNLGEQRRAGYTLRFMP